MTPGFLYLYELLFPAKKLIVCNVRTIFQACQITPKQGKKIGVKEFIFTIASVFKLRIPIYADSLAK